MIPKLKLLFTREGWSAQPYSIKFVWTIFYVMQLEQLKPLVAWKWATTYHGERLFFKLETDSCHVFLVTEIVNRYCLLKSLICVILPEKIWVVCLYTRAIVTRTLGLVTTAIPDIWLNARWMKAVSLFKWANKMKVVAEKKMTITFFSDRFF